MRTRWPILALLCVLASLLVPGVASAQAASGAENRVRAFDLPEQVHVAGEHALTPGLHSGCELAGYESASGSLLAAEGGPKVGPKITKQMGKRGWTQEAIEEAIESGEQIKAVNKATGNPATRYVHPKTGQSVVVDNVTGEVIHVGGPGFKYGPPSGDMK